MSGAIIGLCNRVTRLQDIVFLLPNNMNDLICFFVFNSTFSNNSAMSWPVPVSYSKPSALQTFPRNVYYIVNISPRNICYIVNLPSGYFTI